MCHYINSYVTLGNITKKADVNINTYLALIVLNLLIIYSNLNLRSAMTSSQYSMVNFNDYTEIIC